LGHQSGRGWPIALSSGTHSRAICGEASTIARISGVQAM
jgi:hypothetical protein